MQFWWINLISWADALAPSVSGLFKWRQFEPEVILLAVGWYLRFSLSYRDVEDLLAERGLLVDHVTVWRLGCSVTPRKWNDVFARDSNRPLTVGGWTRPTSGSRASGATCIVRWILPARPSTFSSRPSRTRPQQSASRAKALGRQNHPVPRVINTDGHSAYPPAIVRLKAEGALDEDCRHPPVPYLNNVLEQDHRAIKRRVNASQHFRSFWGAWRTIAGYEAIHMIRKGQACWSAAGVRGCLRSFTSGRAI